MIAEVARFCPVHGVVATHRKAFFVTMYYIRDEQAVHFEYAANFRQNLVQNPGMVEAIHVDTID